MKNDNALAHGAGTGLLALLGLLGRCGDDVARIGVRSIDDAGRACIRNTDEVGSLVSTSSDDLVRSVDDFHVANYADDLRLNVSSPRVVPPEADEATSLVPRATNEVAEVTLKFIDLNDNENNK